jgi:glycosyltransferase involved in cell wall biosynthesis
VIPADSSCTWGLVGLVRTVDRAAGRHRYAVGRIGEGELAGELASLRLAPGSLPVPVWIDADGSLRTDSYRPPAVTARAEVRARWALAPLGWPDVLPLGERLREVAVRGRRPARGGGAQRDRDLPSRPPDGFLDAASGPGMLPLYSGVHPVTGDQFVTTDLLELSDLGYVDPVELGHAVAAAYLTGRLGTDPLTIPWASRLGRRARRLVVPVAQRPLGSIDSANPAGRLPALIWGWALAPVGRVARIEIELNGRPCGRARIGTARPDVAAVFGEPCAHTAGFEFTLLPSHIRDDDWTDGRLELEVAATAFGYRGESHRLAPLRLSVPEPERPDPIEETWGVELRARTSRRLAAVVGPRATGRSALVFSHSLALGGAQLYLVELLARLRARSDFNATLVAFGDGPLRKRIEDLGIPVHVSGEVALTSADVYEGRVAELASWAAAGGGFDVAIVNTLCAFPGVDVAAALGIPALFAIHESYDLDEFWGQAYNPDFVSPYARRRASLALREASAVVFEAEATRRLYEAYAADPARHMTIPYAIELAELDAFRALQERDVIRRKLGFSPDDKVLLCLGTAEPRKAQSMLVDAFCEVADGHPDAVLAIVGLRDDAYSDALRERALAAGLGPRLRLEPLSTQPLAWHAAADYLVCASDVESLPRVILEAMAFELPVISTAVFGVADLIDDGATGYLCRPRDGAALAIALERALSASAAERQAIGRAASRQVRSEHDPDAYAARIELLLDEIAQPAPALVEPPPPGEDVLAA